jgi:hypothetical protein
VEEEKLFPVSKDVDMAYVSLGVAADQQIRAQ